MLAIDVSFDVSFTFEASSMSPEAGLQQEPALIYCTLHILAWACHLLYILQNSFKFKYLSKHMYIYIYVCVCMYMCIYIYTGVDIDIDIDIYIYRYTYTYTYTNR